MPTVISRRALARYAVDQLVAGNKTQTISKQLASALITSNRAKDYDLLLSDIAEELENRGLLAQATLTTATELNANFKKQLSAHLKKAAKVDSLIINEQIDKTVIGGFKLTTANHSWDKTIARKLADIKGEI